MRNRPQPLPEVLYAQKGGAACYVVDRNGNAFDIDSGQAAFYITKSGQVCIFDGRALGWLAARQHIYVHGRAHGGPTYYFAREWIPDDTESEPINEWLRR
jgi:hypothetical protein